MRMKITGVFLFFHKCLHFKDDIYLETDRSSCLFLFCFQNKQFQHEHWIDEQFNKQKIWYLYQYFQSKTQSMPNLDDISEYLMLTHWYWIVHGNKQSAHLIWNRSNTKKQSFQTCLHTLTTFANSNEFYSSIHCTIWLNSVEMRVRSTEHNKEKKNQSDSITFVKLSNVIRKKNEWENFKKTILSALIGWKFFFVSMVLDCYLFFNR